MKYSRKINQCKNGHNEKDVIQAKVLNTDGKIIAYRYKCKMCRRSMDVSSSENLIGNPFSIVERMDNFKTELVLAYVDKVISDEDDRMRQC